jgi:hypothetical protein
VTLPSTRASFSTAANMSSKLIRFFERFAQRFAIGLGVRRRFERRFELLTEARKRRAEIVRDRVARRARHLHQMLQAGRAWR